MRRGVRGDTNWQGSGLAKRRGPAEERACRMAHVAMKTRVGLIVFTGANSPFPKWNTQQMGMDWYPHRGWRDKMRDKS